uniref:JmjC domain-containing protein n=2 Tax=Odontella aurita TaxID=265563 RepID=A0A7S4KCG8_9STRA|mmetsp:Transcript_9447/g.28404  ORF Transcript_9447/g.28404 Transcript_9447/m.28404 type:complete len:131 (+) Transcript_9447:188-580(+)
MVAMIKGAKRYVLGPPQECSKLGIETTKKHPTFRHSLLNFAHLNILDEESEDARSMPPEERKWLEVARDSQAVETVLKAGEVLYIPSHWFHYITSLQKSAQCNTRSGREKKGTEWFGGFEDVVQCVGEGA